MVREVRNNLPLLKTFSDEEVEDQIQRERKEVRYDIADLTAEIVARKLRNKDIYVPDYQRDLIWPLSQQSRLIESLVLSLPIPFIFCSDMKSGSLEIVDGSQRLRTILSYFDDEFELQDLEILDKLNGYKYSDLPEAQKKKLNNRPVRMMILEENEDYNLRFNIFHRLNTLGKKLTDAQIRRGAFPGKFLDLIRDLSDLEIFKELCPLRSLRDSHGERQELALRFFAYSDRYKEFTHDVAAFLNDYLVEKNSSRTLPKVRMEREFTETLSFVRGNFPNGFRKSASASQIPRVRFEAIAIGTFLALKSKKQIHPRSIGDWINSQEFAFHTRSEASNSGPRLRSRVEYVRDRLLGKPQSATT